jgi:AcrR family transcriptional regulator
MKYRSALLLITATLGVIGIVGYQIVHLTVPSDDHRAEIITEPPVAVSPEQKMQQLNLLAARLNSAANYQPTPEEAEEDNQHFRERVAAIQSSFAKHSSEERLSDIERLGSYPVPEAIELLAVILATDPDPAVREMAARTLSGPEPDPRSVDALLAALTDPSGSVQSAALLALELLLNESATEELRVRIIRGLERTAKEPHLTPRLQIHLAEVLSDRRAID